MKKELTILPDQQLAQVQSEFNKLFPFLKLQFYLDCRENAAAYLKKTNLNLEFSIGKWTRPAADKIVINEWMSVAEIEKIFYDNFKIRIRVFRRAGISWLETTVTMDWRLDYQNRQGEETSKILN